MSTISFISSYPTPPPPSLHHHHTHFRVINRHKKISRKQKIFHPQKHRPPKKEKANTHPAFHEQKNTLPNAAKIPTLSDAPGYGAAARPHAALVPAETPAALSHASPLHQSPQAALLKANHLAHSTAPAFCRGAGVLFNAGGNKHTLPASCRHGCGIEDGRGVLAVKNLMESFDYCFEESFNTVWSCELKQRA